MLVPGKNRYPFRFFAHVERAPSPVALLLRWQDTEGVGHTVERTDHAVALIGRFSGDHRFVGCSFNQTVDLFRVGHPVDQLLQQWV